MSKSLVVQLALLISQYLIYSCEGALSVELAKGEEFCFAFKTPGDEASRITGSYDMLDDALSADPITAVLFDYETENVLWHSKAGLSEGSFSLLNKGKFHFCFGNGAGGYKTDEDKHREMMELQGHPAIEDEVFDYANVDGKNRHIGFTLRVEPTADSRLAREQAENSHEEGSMNTEQASKLVELTYELTEKLELLLDHQEYIKGREALHRHVVEQTFTMVMRWTFLEATVLTAVACAQVFYLKRFFETKRFL